MGLEGQILPLPGFCYNRLSDFTCHIWVEPSDVANHQNLLAKQQATLTGQAIPGVESVLPAEMDTSEEYPYMYNGIPDLTIGLYDYTNSGNYNLTQ